METNKKWLVVLFEGITPVQWFFIGLGTITYLFVRLMMSHYEKTTSRKFKKEDVEKKPGKFLE